MLNRIKEFEKISRDNRAAIKRQILYCLVLIRDAHKEMQEAIDKSDKIAEGGADDDSDEDAMEDEDGLDETLDESEKLVASTVVALTVALEDALKQASKIASKGDGDADLDWGSWWSEASSLTFLFALFSRFPCLFCHYVVFHWIVVFFSCALFLHYFFIRFVCLP